MSSRLAIRATRHAASSTRALGVLGLLASFHVSCDAPLVPIPWQWANGRAAQTKAVVEIKALATPGDGWFGIGRSPSIANNLPDPVDLEGQVVTSSPHIDLDRMLVRLPRSELGTARVGQRVALGMFDNSCICVAAVPEYVAAANVTQWLDAWRCAEASQPKP
ncbi:MAG: hypothetical protein QM778_21550 [Myxococcales bacterium]